MKMLLCNSCGFGYCWYMGTGIMGNGQPTFYKHVCDCCENKQYHTEKLVRPSQEKDYYDPDAKGIQVSGAISKES